MINYPQRPPPDFIYKPPKGCPDIIYQDDRLVVISKPSGLLSVPGRKAEHQDCAQNRVQDVFPQALIVHRLDMDTSGLMVMALDAQAHRDLGLQFERRTTEKEYIANVWGGMDAEEGLVDLPLLCDWPNRPVQRVDLTRGKQAQTRWAVLTREGDMTRVSLKPITGRTHQLRVHMAEIGHPILGDDFYAHERAYKSSSRLQLHAHKLMVHHPDDGRQIWFESPCPF